MQGALCFCTTVLFLQYCSFFHKKQCVLYHCSMFLYNCPGLFFTAVPFFSTLEQKRNSVFMYRCSDFGHYCSIFFPLLFRFIIQNNGTLFKTMEHCFYVPLFRFCTTVPFFSTTVPFYHTKQWNIV